MELETSISDMLYDLAAMVARAKNAWQDFDVERLLDSLENIASQAPQIVDAIYATVNHTPAQGKE